MGCFERDKRRDGWSLVVDNGEPRILVLASLGLIPVLWENEHEAETEVMCARSRRERGDFGHRHGEALLRVSEFLPDDWKGTRENDEKVILLPGTRWEHQGSEMIPGFYYSTIDRTWRFTFHWVGHPIRRHHYLIKSSDLITPAEDYLH